MRSFFASFFGTLAAFVVGALGILVVVVALISGARIESETPPKVKPGSWLVLDLSTPIRDSPSRPDGLEALAEALGERQERVLQAREVTRALEAAAADPDIGGLYLSGQNPGFGNQTGYAAIAEVRRAILAFRAAGKPVKAWLTYGGTREYLLASAADNVALDPFGSLMLPGLAAQPVFLAGTFEKLGIGVQVTRVGRYKSAIEPYTRRDMSPESREQTQKLLGDLWGDVARSIEETRRLEPGTVQKLADASGLLSPEAARDARLVDRLAYVDEVLQELRDATGTTGALASFKQVRLDDYARLVPTGNLVAKRGAATSPSRGPGLAIVYAEGPILDGAGSEPGVTWGDKVARDLRRARRDDAIKAVVLRVNSPGGSVTASEAIQREVRLLREKKPVVVSMGSYAASGGYWIATYSDRIFAEPSTITGSIGVFGVLFNVQELATGHLGLSFDTVKTARFADATTPTRPKTPEEIAIVQERVDWFYSQFLSKVAESRRLDRARVDEIAQGRVWSGAEAQRLGLVDELGGLDAAIRHAAAAGKLGEEFDVSEFPVRKRLIDAITDAIAGKHDDTAGSRALAALFGSTLDAVTALASFNDPAGIYARLPFDLQVR